MNRTTHLIGGPRASVRRALRPSACAMAVALLLAGMGDAMAQAAEQTVTVTGIRRGIEGAISVKKSSDSIVEAISAEDIGKLPDSSIAESIARLPGLAAQRVAGRAQVISVRGLSPDFATTLLNGREQVSTGDNRSVEFDQYPSELLSGVTIYKTPDAALVGQGLSGTLDMQTVRPLSFGSRTVSMNARYERNSLGSTANASANGNRFSVSYIDQFANRTVGVALGFAHLESPVLEQQVGVYEPWKADSRPGVPAGTLITDGIKSLARSGVNKRDGLMAVVEWRPSKEWTSLLDLYTSKFSREDTANQFEVNIGGYNGGYEPGLRFTSATVSPTGVLSGGVATGVYPLVRGMYNDRQDKINAIGWNNKFKIGGISVVADLNYSKAKRDEVSLENNLQLAKVGGVAPLDALTLNWATGGFPTLAGTKDYSDASKLFIDNTIYGSGYGKVPRVEDELKGFKLVASLPVPGGLSGFFSEADIGINYAERSKMKRQPEASINLGSQGPTTISSDLQYSPVDLGFSGTGIIPAWNVPAVVAKYMTFSPDSKANYLIGKAWDVQEKITTSFLKANIDSKIGGMSVRGNVGVQIVHTDQSSAANYWDGSAPAGQEVKPVSDGKTYTDVLPSLNLAFDLGADQTVRVALAKQMARPRVDQLRSALEFGVSTTPNAQGQLEPGASGGNTRLDPWRANAFDISYEKYFGTRAYVAAAGFYKDLTSYIYEQTKTFDFSKFTPGTPATTNLGSYKAPYNGQGGKLKGIELTASLPLNMVSRSLDGFGVVASYSYNDSNITIKDPDSNTGSENIPLPGLSKRVSNLTAYYEKAGFSARISQRKRSDFVGEIGNFANNRTLRYVVGESVVDAQIGYTFESGSMKGLGLLLQVNNLTDEAYQTYAASKDKPYEYIKYGRTVLFGANYKF
ncbi:TonB-dependent receptor [Ideonella sp. A 288]|uniref:TonB-dependent receptor n=1 Tax=Ideonella sp. A 288 TaxID=1962181 RepID=UPI001F421B5E|nr:TonB-dependent receptor [Ideonella sp. A 288]